LDEQANFAILALAIYNLSLFEALSLKNVIFAPVLCNGTESTDIYKNRKRTTFILRQ